MHRWGVVEELGGIHFASICSLPGERYLDPLPSGNSFPRGRVSGVMRPLHDIPQSSCGTLEVMPLPPSTRPPGRPSKLTPSLQAHLAELLEAGNSMDTAARASGITPATLYRWTARGQAAADLEANGDEVPAEDQPHLALWAAVAAARAKAEVQAVGVIWAAAEAGSWKAAAWWLERSQWQRWGRRVALAATLDPDPTPSALDAREELRRKLDLMVSRMDEVDQPLLN